MDILLYSAANYIEMIKGIIYGIIILFIISLLFYRKSGGLEFSGILIDFLKIIFYGVLAFREMLVILLSILEFFSNIVSLRGRFVSIANESEKNFKKEMEKLERERHLADVKMKHELLMRDHNKRSE